MQEWYLINPQPTMLSGGVEQEEWDNWVGDSFDEVLVDTPLGKEIYLCRGSFDGENFETEVKTEGIVQTETPDAYTQGWQRQLLTRISDAVQDYKYVKYDGMIWLIMNMPSDNTIYNKCVLHLCNYTLKWQNKITGEVYLYPASVLNATQYNTGVQNKRDIMQTGFLQLNAWLSLDDITQTMQRGLRMFLDLDKTNPSVFVITSKMPIPFSYGNDKRVMYITFSEDEYNPDVDSIDEWICDYVNPSDIPQPTTPIEIDYSGLPEIRVGGRKTFTSTLSGAIFSLILPSAFEGKVSLVQTGDKAVVKAVNDSAMVGGNFKVVLSGNGLSSELTVNVKGAV